MENWRFCAAAVFKEENYRRSDSWTSISDVGRIYHGHEFTFNDYRKTEQAYIRFLTSLFEYLHAQKIRLIHLEVYDDYPPIAMYDQDGILRKWHNKIFNNMSLTLEDIQYVVPLILRENACGTLYHKSTKTYIRFGYDYYVYVNSPLLFQVVDGKDFYNIDFIEMVYQNGLYLK